MERTVADGRGHDDDAVTGVDAAGQPTGASPATREHDENHASSEQAEIREHIQQAIAALQTLDGAL